MKKTLPLNLIKKFKPEYGENISVVKPTENDKFIALFLDSDPDSDFLFRIENGQNANDYILTYSPSSENSVSEYRSNTKTDSIGPHFKKWHDLIQEYNHNESFLDDPILKGHSENYFSEFELIDEKDWNRPLTANQMLLLDEHLEDVIKGISKFQTDSNEEVIKEIIEKAEELRDSLSKKTKKQIIKGLTWMWSCMTKESVSIVKEFLTQSIRRSVSDGFNSILDSTSELLK